MYCAARLFRSGGGGGVLPAEEDDSLAEGEKI
jgi:hypothetical protein